MKCYMCGPCGSDNGQSTECPALGNMEYFCQKTTSNDIVARSCLPKVAGLTVGCVSSDSGEVCLCDSDNCNGAGSLQNTLILKMAAAAIVAAKVAFLY